jgi:hypothetical protein
MRSLLILSLVLADINTSLNAQVFYDHGDPGKNHSKYELIDFAFGPFFEKTIGTGNVQAQLDFASYGRFDISLTPSDLMLNDAEMFTQGDARTYFKVPSHGNQWKGTDSRTGMMARLNIYANCLNGYVETDAGMLFIETRMHEGKPQLVVYRSADSKTGLVEDFCRHAGVSIPRAPLSAKRELNYDDYSCRIVKIATISGYSIFRKNKYDTLRTFNEMKDVVNLSDGIFARYVGIRLKVAFQAIGLDSQATYNTSNTMLGRLEDINKKRKQFAGKLVPDLYHLFTETYTALDNAVGIAYLAGVCSAYNNTGASMYQTLNYRVKVFSHEIGHNMGAEHSHGTLCSVSGRASIMCPGGSFDTSLYFGANEIAVMKDKMKALMETSTIDETKYCLEYPVSNYMPDMDLNGIDSVVIPINSEAGFRSGQLWHEGRTILNTASLAKITVKKDGLYTLVYYTDTVNGLSCRYEDRFFVARRNFVVRNGNVNGPGSIGNAIRNSNICKGLDTITFDLPAGMNVIDIDTFITPVIDSCFIDGTSQKGYKKATRNAVYDPAVTFRSKLPLNLYSDRLCFVLAREKYIIRGLKFEDFHTAIYTDFYYFKYTTEYKNWLEDFRDSNYKAEYEIKGNKFVNLVLPAYINLYEVNNGTDHVLIGGDSIWDANFFLHYTNGGQGFRIAYSKSSDIRGNYFGMEPGIDTMGKIYNGFTLNTCLNTKVSGNAIGNSMVSGIELMNSSGYVRNNTIGMNAFNKNVCGYNGAGISIAGYPAVDSMMRIGGAAAQGNILIGQRKGFYLSAPVLCQSVRNLHISGNAIINVDTAAILIINPYDPYPLKALALDSASLDCSNANTLKIYGTVTPNIMNDTFQLHFYSVPEGVEAGHEPMHKYLGSSLLYAQDTFRNGFSKTISGLSANEGVVFTATSVKRKLSSHVSNAAYPKAKGHVWVSSLLADTCLCPRKELQVIFMPGLKSFRINDVPVPQVSMIKKAGAYEMSAIDSSGCLVRQKRFVSFYPDYLSGADIRGGEDYTPNTYYGLNLVNAIYSKYWGTYAWTGQNTTFAGHAKLSSQAGFGDDSAKVSYQVTDVNKCVYAFSRTFYEKGTKDTVGLLISSAGNGFSVYPNPFSGILTFSRLVHEKVELYNSLGQVIMQWPATEQGMKEIDLASLPLGMYILRAGSAAIKVMNYKL